ncbi:MAG TPA: hypothetical protein EYM65_10050 [Dehalococcoidia bacterium]|nr:hypothetical protein [Dehalococcoidia bacterium]
MNLRLVTAIYMSALVLAIACGSAVPSIYEDILLSCSTVSPALEEKSRNFSDTGGKVKCHGGEKQSTKDSPTGRGPRPRALNFAMYVATHERPPDLSMIKGQIGFRDNIKVVRTPNLPWEAPAVVDDYVRAEYRAKISLKTGKPEVSYVIHAVVGNTLFGVLATDYAAYIARENIPVGNAMWKEAERTFELLISRYQTLQ